MCVGLPGRVVEILDADNRIVRVEVADRHYDVSAAILAEDEDVAVGDWLEIHMGFALAKLEEDEARGMLEFMEELDAAHHGEVPDRDPGQPDDQGG